MKKGSDKHLIWLTLLSTLDYSRNADKLWKAGEEAWQNKDKKWTDKEEKFNIKENEHPLVEDKGGFKRQTHKVGGILLTPSLILFDDIYANGRHDAGQHAGRHHRCERVSEHLYPSLLTS